MLAEFKALLKPYLAPILRFSRAEILVGLALLAQPAVLILLAAGYLLAIAFYVVLLSGVEGGISDMGDIGYLFRVWLIIYSVGLFVCWASLYTISRRVLLARW